MLHPLIIEKIHHTRGTDTYRISGFQDGELYELKAMPHNKAEETLILMLDERNGNKGTCWACGYGIQSTWFDNEYAYMNVGDNCD